MTARHAATVAPDDVIGGGFALIHAAERAVLRTLPLWMHALWCELLAHADYKTGAGVVSVPQLVAALQPIQPARGPRFWAPDAQDISRAVATLEERRLIARDKRRSAQERALFFMVAPRVTKARPRRNSTP